MLSVSVRRLVFALILFSPMVFANSSAQVLLFDDFDAVNLDYNVWNEGYWHHARTQLGNPSSLEDDGQNTYLSLKLDTYNPNEPGISLFGSNIYSLERFDVDTGLELESRFRTVNTSSGTIAALFLYDQDSQGLADEIDFELLSSQGRNSLLATSWNNWGDSQGTFNDGIHHSGSFLDINGYDQSEWQTYTIRWFPDRVEWYVNGELVKQQDSPVPDISLAVHSNFWAADSNWQEAFGADLIAAADPVNNQRFFLDIDYIKVSRITDDGGIGGELLPVEVQRNVTASWDTGFCEEVFVTNPDVRTRDWSVNLEIDGVLNFAWNADVSMAAEGLLNAQGNNLAVDQTASFGFCANKPIANLSNEDLLIDRQRIAEWDGGYCESITITNHADTIGIWNVSLDMPDTTTVFWSSQMTQSDGVLNIVGVDWNEKLNPNESTTVGFCASN